MSKSMFGSPADPLDPTRTIRVPIVDAHAMGCRDLRPFLHLHGDVHSSGPSRPPPG